MSLFASQRLLALVDALLPTWVTRDGNTVLRNRGRRLVATVVGAMAIAILSGVFHWLTDTPARGLFNMSCSLVGAVVLAVPHWTGWRARRRAAAGRSAPEPTLRPTLDTFLAALFVAMLIGPALSSKDFNVPVAIATLPFLAATLGGLQAGIVWTTITLTVLGGMTVATWADPVRSLVGGNAFIVAVVVGVGGCIAEAAREQARRAAEASSRVASGLARDRDEKDAELKANRELLAYAFRRMPALLTLSEMSTGRILDVNECFERISGWTLDEVRGRTFSELNAWVSPDDRRRMFEAALERGRAHDLEIALRTRSGSEIWVLLNVDILERGGRSLVLAQGIDITERRRIERERAAARTLLEERVVEGSERLRESQLELGRQRQLASIGTLAAGIAHQINNPIASIMAAAEYALLTTSDTNREGDAIRDEALRSVIGEASRCGQIVKNVLRFARQQPTARWVEDLVPLVIRATTLCRGYVGEHGGELHVETDGSPLRALVSPIEIEQVLVNLIRNAAEAIEPGGSVSVRTRLRGDRLEVAIDDDGRGMAGELLDHLFEPFYTTRVHQGGTGLGLAFAHGVVVDHGGEIHVESQPGKGTRIRIELPLAPA